MTGNKIFESIFFVHHNALVYYPDITIKLSLPIQNQNICHIRIESINKKCSRYFIAGISMSLPFFAIMAKRDASEKRTIYSSHGAKQLTAHIFSTDLPSDGNVINTVLL